MQALGQKPNGTTLVNTAPHLEETLQRDIDSLKGKFKSMAERSVAALSGGLQALLERNRRHAYLVILRDQYIDQMETELDRLCLEFLVRHQPVGVHLRFAYTIIQANKAIERIGDYAESVAAQVLALSSVESFPPVPEIEQLGRLAIKMVSDASRSLLEQDAALAQKTSELEQEANALRDSINSELVLLSQAGRLPSAALGPLTTVTRRFERTADQAKNLCEEVLYLCTGEFIKHKRPEGFRILFVDQNNSCLSQMAEAIGTSLDLRGFSFSSAGLTPKPIDPATREFLTAKGMDLSKQTSKSLEEVSQWAKSNVIIALGETVQEQLPSHRAKTFELTWAAPNPLEAPAGQKLQVFTAALQFLEANIRDLTDAIVDNHKQQPTTQI